MKNENKSVFLGKKMIALYAVVLAVFIGVGIMNSLLGTAWPAISPDIGVPISWQSLIIVINFAAATFGAAIVEKLLARFGTLIVILLGLVIIVVAVFIYAVSHTFTTLVIMGALLGFGLGLEQPSTNGIVAKHFPAAMMSWLHCGYAAGGMLAPVILSYYIINETWRQGYKVTGSILICVIVVAVLAIPLWKLIGPIIPKKTDTSEEEKPTRVKSLPELFRVPGGTIIPLVMYLYCSFEVSMFFWATSFLTEEKGMSAGVAAGIITYFYVGLVAGRFFSGIISFKVRDRSMIRVMMILALVGAVLLIVSSNAMLPPVLLFLGFASGPLFPLLVHETPSIVGAENAQGVMGIQLAAGNLGTATIPLVLGIVAGNLGFWVFGVFLIVLLISAIIMKAYQDRKYRDK